MQYSWSHPGLEPMPQQRSFAHQADTVLTEPLSCSYVRLWPSILHLYCWIWLPTCLFVCIVKPHLIQNSIAISIIIMALDVLISLWKTLNCHDWVLANNESETTHNWWIIERVLTVRYCKGQIVSVYHMNALLLVLLIVQIRFIVIIAFVLTCIDVFD